MAITTLVAGDMAGGLADLVKHGALMNAPWQFLLLQGFGLAVATIALWRGRRPERIGALVIMINPVWNLFVPPYDPLGPDWPGMAADGLGLIVLTAVVLTSTRRWAIAAAAFQALVVATYVAMAIDLRITATSAAIAMMIWTACVTSCVLVGALTARRPGGPAEA